MSNIARLMQMAAGSGEPSIISGLTLNQSFTYTAPAGTDYGHTWRSDGTKLFVIVGAGIDFIGEYAASTAWDVSSLSYTDKFDVTTISAPRGVTTNSDGTSFYVTGRGDDNADQFSATAWDVSTASYSATESMSVSSPRYDGDCQLVDGGTKFTISETDAIHQYSLSTTDDITTSSYLGELAQSGYAFGGGFCFTPDGLKLISFAFETPSFDRCLLEFDLSTAFDITTAALKDAVLFDAHGTLYGLSLNPDLTKLFVSNPGFIFEYDIV